MSLELSSSHVSKSQGWILASSYSVLCHLELDVIYYVASLKHRDITG